MIVIETEFGEYDFSQHTDLNLIKFFRRQLQFYLDKNMSPNPVFTQSEINAYDRIIKANNPFLAGLFVRMRKQMPKPTVNECVQILKDYGHDL